MVRLDNKRSVLLALFGALGVRAVTQVTNVPLDLIPPSYAQLCTTVNSDGSYSANPALCPNGMRCVPDPTHYNAFYCGGPGAPCDFFSDCATSTYLGVTVCDGTCSAGYGLPPYTYPGSTLYECVINLEPSTGSNPVCGGVGAACSNGDETPRLDTACASGYCAASKCIARVDDIGGACGSTSVCGALLTCAAATSTCERIRNLGETCDDSQPCRPGAYCSSSSAPAGNQHVCLALVTAVGGSCQADPMNQCGTDASSGQAMYCKGQGSTTGAQGATCQRVGTSAFSSCAYDLSGNACVSPLYCSGESVMSPFQNLCFAKAGTGQSCVLDPVNACKTGEYCTSTDKLCRAISTAPGQTCGSDSNACSASSGLYCVTSTQLCARKATSIGATCAFDQSNGCASTSDGQQLYCRASDATCQLRLTTVGADCRNDPITGCTMATAADGTVTPLYCSLPTFQCAAVRTSAPTLLPLDLLPPSYAPLCTTVNPDGSYSPNQAACTDFLVCHQDASRYNAYYCSGSGGPCGNGKCAGGYCNDGTCQGGYAQPETPAWLSTYFPPCAGALKPGINGICGEVGAACSNADSTPRFDAACTSGYCANSQCVEVVNDAGGACSGTSACGPLLQCDSSTSRCQSYGNVGDACNTSDDCLASTTFCALSAAGSGGVCHLPLSEGESCADDPARACESGLYCTSTTRICAPLSLIIGQTCGVDSNACASSADLYCVEATQKCASQQHQRQADCSFDPVNGCGSALVTGQQLYCLASNSTCQFLMTHVGADCSWDPISACAGASCSSNPAQACSSPYYCSSNNDICTSKTTTDGDTCNFDPYAQCGIDPNRVLPPYDGQLKPLIYTDRDGNQICRCFQVNGAPSTIPPPGAFGLTTVGDDCSADPTFSCGYSAVGVKLYCALSTNTCQEHITTVGGSCAYDYLGACGVTTDGSYAQLFPSIPTGSSGHADCTCVTEADVVVRPSSRARARMRARRALSLCPGAHTACPVGNGFECIDTTSNIEQCGGCSGDSSSVDCSALEGVAAVGCVDSRCEIWACEEGYSFAPERELCVRD